MFRRPFMIVELVTVGWPAWAVMPVRRACRLVLLSCNGGPYGLNGAFQSIPPDIETLFVAPINGADKHEEHGPSAALLDHLPLVMPRKAACIYQRRPRCSGETQSEKLERSTRTGTTMLRHDAKFPDRDMEASSPI
nr:hypothetical protein CFP56_76651 [Quercus suber]